MSCINYACDGVSSTTPRKAYLTKPLDIWKNLLYLLSLLISFTVGVI